MSQKLVNYMYELPEDIVKPAEKVQKFLEEAKENNDVVEVFKNYEENRLKAVQLLSKYQGNPSVYKPEEVVDLILLSTTLNEIYKKTKEMAIKGLPTKKANEAGKELYQRVVKTKKSLDTALEQILKERGNEILRFYKDQSEGTLETSETIEKEISKYVK